MSSVDHNRRHILWAAALAHASAADTLTAAERQGRDARPSATSPLRAESFGAVGDGLSDDSTAFQRAIASVAPGAVLELTPGRTYRLTSSLVFDRPIVVAGGAKENTRIVFDNGTYASLGGHRAAMIFPHETSNRRGTSRRTRLSGFSVEWIGQRNADVHGMLISAPVYFYEIDAVAFPLDGFRVEAQTPKIPGNANGSSFMNCSALRNGGNGFAFYGNDANACIVIGSRSFDNAGIGFFDGSLIGNTYIAAEVDGNKGGGFASDKTLPNRSVYIGCYAEPDQRYDLNARNLTIAPLGFYNGLAGAMLRALPSGEIYSRTNYVFANSEDQTVQGTIKSNYLRVGATGIDLMHADGQRVRLGKLLSPNYVDVLNGTDPVIRFPAGAISGNVNLSRPWLPNGLALGASGQSAIVGSGTAPPSSGAFEKGALWLNDAPQPGRFVGWACTTSGAPGIWHPFGKIES